MVRAIKAGWPVALLALMIISAQILETWQISIANEVLIAAIAVLGYNVLFGNAGQISIGSAAFVAIGGFAGGVTVADLGIPFPLAVLGGGALAAVIGLLIGIPSLRLSGHYLVFSTLALHFIALHILNRLQTNPAGWFLPNARFAGIGFGTDPEKWFVLYAVLAVGIMWLVVNMLGQRPGRSWTLVKEHPESAAAMGIDVVFWRLLAFSFSAFFFGIAGSLQVVQFRHLHIDNYSLELAIIYAVMVLVGGLGSVLGSIAGAITVVLIPHLIQRLLDAGTFDVFGSFSNNLERNQFQLSLMVYGSLLIVALLFEPGGIADLILRGQRAVTRLGRGVFNVMRGLPSHLEAAPGQMRRLRWSHAASVAGLAPAGISTLRRRLARAMPLPSQPERATALSTPANPGTDTLEASNHSAANSDQSAEPPLVSIQGLSVGYGGDRVSVEDISLTMDKGSIVALLGHNAAGKSTTIRAIVGFLRGERVRVTADSMMLNGKDIRGLSPYSIAHMGVSFVPQRDKIFPGLTVEEHLKLRLPSNRQERQRIENEIFEVLPILRDLRKRTAGYLSGGERQMLSLALALAGQPSLMILDEVSLGLSPIAIMQLSDVLRRLNNERGMTILMAEQNARMALDLSDKVYVLVNGRVAAQGPASEWSASRLQEVYLRGRPVEGQPDSGPRKNE